MCSYGFSCGVKRARSRDWAGWISRLAVAQLHSGGLLIQVLLFAQEAGFCACRALLSSFPRPRCAARSEEHTSELQSLMRISYAVFCLKKKKKHTIMNIQRVIARTTTMNHNDNDKE